MVTTSFDPIVVARVSSTVDPDIAIAETLLIKPSVVAVKSEVDAVVEDKVSS